VVLTLSIVPIKKPAEAGLIIGTTEWIDNFSLRAGVTCCAGSPQARCLKYYAFYRTAVVLTHSIAPIKKPAEAGLIIGTTEWIDNFSLRAGVTCCAGSPQARCLKCYAFYRTSVVLTHSIAPIKKPAEAGLIIGTTEWIDNFSLRAGVTCCAGSPQARCLKYYAFYRTAVVLTHSIAPIKKPAEAGLIIGTTEWIRTTDPYHVKVVL
jgi:hypothetical protein